MKEKEQIVIFRLDNSDFEKLARANRDADKINNFFAEIRDGAPELYVKIWELSSAFVIRVDPPSAAMRDDFWKRFMIHTFWIMYGLKLCCDVVPHGTVAVYEEISSTSDIFDINEIAKRADLLATINQNWIMCSMQSANQSGFPIEFGLGPIYALAEAYIEAQNRKEAIEAQQEALRQEMPKIEESLRNWGVVDFIEKINMDDLPNGDNNIGEI